MDVPSFYLKGKQAFRMELGSMRQLGNAAQLVRSLSEEYALFHVVDLDALKGNKSNFDLYDHLTYFTHVQVECKPDSKLISALLKMEVRVVVDLPSAIDFEKFGKKKTLVVGKVKPGFAEPFPPLREIIIDGKDDELARRILNEDKRLFVKKEHYPRGFRRAFGVLFEL
ncbi:MAG: hypothetical protein PHQ80_04470 [Candidatus ainarchaeum sp.]|nr:hypothetical protein [Candidatus ainarchaeum sp.]MDD5096094.1 hypothetical protein [Candidatus ainarchaeum sp.]